MPRNGRGRRSNADPCSHLPCTHHERGRTVPSVTAGERVRKAGAAERLGHVRTKLPAQVRRGARYRRRAFLRTFSTVRRVKGCGSRPIQEGGQVQVKRLGEVAHFAGVQMCGLVWVCPVCAPKIRAGRADEIGAALDAAVARGMGVQFLTLTFRHHRGQRLAWLRKASERVWRSCLSDRAWRGLQERWGVEWVQVRELTWGPENGWHPHRHLALLTRRPLARWELDELEESIWRLWVRKLGNEGLSAERGPGCDLRAYTDANALARYMGKVEGLGQEMARADLKRGGGGHNTPEQLLGEAVDQGDADALALWNEYEQATAGWRMFTWSRGLRKRLLADRVEQTDQELAEKEVGGSVVVVLTPPVWQAVLTASPGGVALLDAVEDDRWRTYLAELVGFAGWFEP